MREVDLAHRFAEIEHTGKRHFLIFSQIVIALLACIIVYTGRKERIRALCGGPEPGSEVEVRCVGDKHDVQTGETCIGQLDRQKAGLLIAAGREQHTVAVAKVVEEGKIERYVIYRIILPDLLTLVTVDDANKKLSRQGKGLARSVEYTKAQLAHGAFLGS